MSAPPRPSMIRAILISRPNVVMLEHAVSCLTIACTISVANSLDHGSKGSGLLGHPCGGLAIGFMSRNMRQLLSMRHLLP